MTPLLVIVEVASVVNTGNETVLLFTRVREVNPINASNDRATPVVSVEVVNVVRLATENVAPEAIESVDPVILVNVEGLTDPEVNAPDTPDNPVRAAAVIVPLLATVRFVIPVRLFATKTPPEFIVTVALELVAINVSNREIVCVF